MSDIAELEAAVLDAELHLGHMREFYASQSAGSGVAGSGVAGGVEAMKRHMVRLDGELSRAVGMHLARLPPLLELQAAALASKAAFQRALMASPGSSRDVPSAPHAPHAPHEELSGGVGRGLPSSHPVARALITAGARFLCRARLERVRIECMHFMAGVQAHTLAPHLTTPPHLAPPPHLGDLAPLLAEATSLQQFIFQRVILSQSQSRSQSQSQSLDVTHGSASVADEDSNDGDGVQRGDRRTAADSEIESNMDTHTQLALHVGMTSEQFHSQEHARSILAMADVFPEMLLSRNMLLVYLAISRIADLVGFSAALLTPMDRKASSDLVVEIYSLLQQIDKKTLFETLVYESAAPQIQAYILWIIQEYTKGPRLSQMSGEEYCPIKQYHRRDLLNNCVWDYLNSVVCNQQTHPDILVEILSTATAICSKSRLGCESILSSPLLPNLCYVLDRLDSDGLVHYHEFIRTIAPWIRRDVDEKIRLLLSAQATRFLDNITHRKDLYATLCKLHHNATYDVALRLLQYLQKHHGSNQVPEELFPELFSLIYAIFLGKYDFGSSMLQEFNAPWIQSLCVSGVRGATDEGNQALLLLSHVIKCDLVLIQRNTIDKLLEIAAQSSNQHPEQLYALIPLGKYFGCKGWAARLSPSEFAPKISPFISSWLEAWLRACAYKKKSTNLHIPILRGILSIVHGFTANGHYEILSEKAVDRLNHVLLFLRNHKDPRIESFSREFNSKIQEIFVSLYELPVDKKISSQLWDRVCHTLENYFDYDYKIYCKHPPHPPLDEVKKLFMFSSSIRRGDSISLAAAKEHFIMSDVELTRLDFSAISSSSEWILPFNLFVRLVLTAQYAEDDEMLIQLCLDVFRNQVHIGESPNRRQLKELLSFVGFHEVLTPRSRGMVDMKSSKPATVAEFYDDLLKCTREKVVKSTGKGDSGRMFYNARGLRYTRKGFIDLMTEEHKVPVEFVKKALEHYEFHTSPTVDTLDRSTFVSLFESICDARYRKFAKGLFDLFDEDGSNAIDIEEVIAGLWMIESQPDWISTYAFRIIDEDRSGFITRSELEAFLQKNAHTQSLGMDLDAFVGALFDIYDENGDDSISLQEMKQALENPLYQSIFLNISPY
eukprot:TRINITY_DN2963_c0_g1_i2.p1 TRINITY_DN2963_c0_g1~~TRINITY_DN2963_c0_g1_i2.p1  ORF type:complete len:1118 (-),score=176.95 TRINITY_DN2963_c0_g1_i2:38-3391(-)